MWTKNRKMRKEDRMIKILKRLASAPFPTPVNGFIENQEEWTDVRFGWHPDSTISKTGCGLIAMWNALSSAGRIRKKNARHAMATLMDGLGRFGSVLGGRLGVSVASLYVYSCFHFRRAQLCFRHNSLAQNSFGLRHDAVIATVVNERRHPFRGLHTICITRSKKGYVIHNAYRKNSQGVWSASKTYRTLSEALCAVTEAPFFVVMIGITF